MQVANVHLNILRPLLALIEDVAKRPRNESSIVIAARSSSHRESFTTTGLTIGKDSAVETLHSRIYNVLGDFIKNFLLFGVHIEHLVELKHPLFIFVIDISLIFFLRDKERRLTFLFIQGLVIL